MIRSNPSNDLPWVVGIVGIIGVSVYFLNQIKQQADLNNATNFFANRPSSVPGNPDPGTPGYLQKAIGE